MHYLRVKDTLKKRKPVEKLKYFKKSLTKYLYIEYA
jgi:hypothetical protein